MNRRIEIWASALLLTVVAVGCEGLKDPPPKEDPVRGTLPEKKQVEEWEPPKDMKPKVAALPRLPGGAGEMDADVADELTPHESGIYYRILRKSEGLKPGPGDTVVVHYHGSLDDGTVFESSWDTGKPVSLPMNRVIKGWRAGIPLIGEGGMIELEIPYQLAYGEDGQGPKIPPKATLHFIVELKKVKLASPDY